MSAFCCLFSTAVSALDCYECNVWKAGYGYQCYQPRNRTNCVTCMKIETTIFMGFYKNTPRSMLNNVVFNLLSNKICHIISWKRQCIWFLGDPVSNKQWFCFLQICKAE